MRAPCLPTPSVLRARVAIVTGANTGIGPRDRHRFGRSGRRHRRSRPAPLRRRKQNKLLKALGRRFHVIAADLTASTNQVAGDRLRNRRAMLGRLDILINNAGIIRQGRCARIHRGGLGRGDGRESQRRPFFLSQAAARHMIGSGMRGKIVNIASMLSFQGGLRVASYTASKSGLAGLTRLLANEWAAKGVNVERHCTRLFRNEQYGRPAQRCAA